MQPVSASVQIDIHPGACTTAAALQGRWVWQAAMNSAVAVEIKSS
jgi:hypothetical protein